MPAPADSMPLGVRRGRRYLVHDVAFGRERSSGSSWFNDEEAVFVVGLLGALAELLALAPTKAHARAGAHNGGHAGASGAAAALGRSTPEFGAVGPSAAGGAVSRPRTLTVGVIAPYAPQVLWE